MADKQTSIEYLNTLRAWATFGVIMIHIATPALKMNFPKNMEFWWIANIIDCTIRFSVPIFLMLTGATLLGGDYQLGEFYKKRFRRVLFPFLFWMIIYWIFRWIILSPKLQPQNVMAWFEWSGNLFLKEGISMHFWYVYMILFLYLIVPFVSKMILKISSSTLLFLLIGWLVLAFITRHVQMNFYAWRMDLFGGKVYGWMLHGAYLLLGYYLVKLPKTTTKIRSVAIFLFVMSIISAAGFTFFFSTQGRGLDITMYNYLHINTVIQSIAFFLIFKDSSTNNRIVSMLYRSICKYSYGIYLVHMLVIGILFRNGIYWNFTYPLISVPLLTLIVLAISFGVIYVLHKIPLGKYIAG